MFAPNIDTKGRIFRALGGSLFLFGIWPLAQIPRPWPLWAIIVFISLLIAGVFMLFEAARGWCALRACGLKTPY